MLVFFFLVLLQPGCGQPDPPLSGGKPVSYWLEALQDKDATLRQKAVAKLGNVGATDAAVYPALTEALSDVDASVRGEAILALMKFGEGAKEAVPILADMERQDRDARVRTLAAKALARLSAAR
jgi:HEAT repeat protein